MAQDESSLFAHSSESEDDGLEGSLNELPASDKESLNSLKKDINDTLVVNTRNARETKAVQTEVRKRFYDYVKARDAAVATLATKEAQDKEDKERRKNVQDALNKTSNALKDVSRQVGVAVSAFKSGDNLTGTGAVMDICATISGVIGTIENAAGIAGALFGALFGLLATVLRAFAPPQQSLTDKIEGMLREVFGEGYKHEIKAAISDYNVSFAAVADMTRHNQVMTAADMDRYCPIANSPNALHLYAANDWLEDKNNQSKANRSWHAVLEANLHAGTLQLRNYIMALSILEPPEVRHNMYKGFVEVLKEHWGSLNRLEKAIRNKALIWYLSYDAHLYVRRMEQEENTNLHGESHTFSVARAAGSDVALIFALEGADSILEMSTPFPRHKRTYVRSVGLEFDGPYWKQIEELNGLHDIHALPGHDGQVWLYTTDEAGSAIHLYGLDEDGKAERLGSSYINTQMSRGLNIRGVPGGDASTYYLLTWNEKLYYHIRTTGGNTFGVPWDACYGIATCKTFLWAFKDQEIAYITHEEASRAQGSAPWRKLPPVTKERDVGTAGVYSKHFHGLVIKSLSACDDQVLTAVFLGFVYMTSWKKRDDGSVEIDDWEKLDNIIATRVLRLPLRVWPVYEARRETLNKIIEAASSVD